jgi:hypothetical protein
VQRFDPYSEQTTAQQSPPPPQWSPPPAPPSALPVRQSAQPVPPHRVVPPHVAGGYPQDTGTAEIAPLVPGKALTLQDAMAMRRQQRRQRSHPSGN